MAITLDANDKNFPKVLSAKNAIMASVLTASVRVNDGALRKRSTDRIAALLEEVQQADAAR